MPTLFELKKDLATEREAWLKIYNDAPKKKLDDGTDAPDLTEAQFTEMMNLKASLDQKGAQIQIAEEAQRVTSEGWDPKGDGGSKFVPDFYGGMKAARKSIREHIEAAVKSQGVASFAAAVKNGGKFEVPDLDFFEMKTTMTTSAGFAPEVIRDGDVVMAATRPPQVLDTLPSYNTEQNAIKYMVESTYTSAAAAKAEAAALAEATFAYTETTSAIQRVGHYVPITEEELEDVNELQALIGGRLMFGTLVEADRLATVGNGTAPNLRGLYNATSVQTAAYDGSTAGLETKINALGTAMRQIQVTGYASPNVVYLHGTDLWTIAQQRDSQGRYILGDPSNAPLTRIWGVPIIRTEALTQGNGLVGDTTFCQLARRKGVTFEVGLINDQFIYQLKTLKATMRLGLKIRRGTAFCRVTGL